MSKRFSEQYGLINYCICHIVAIYYIGHVWSVEITDEFEAWFAFLDEVVQDALRASILLLESRGPSLGRPHADTVQGFEALEHEGIANAERRQATVELLRI